MNEILPQRLTVEEFLVWSSNQTEGRYELQDGRVIMQQSQNVGHLRVKGKIWRILTEAIEGVSVPYYVLPDGATVRIGPRTAFEPDALVAPLPMPENSSLEIPNPVIVVEVLSPSSVKRDLKDKVIGYFKVASIVHYLVLDPEERELVWHRRAEGGNLAPPEAMKEGVLRLDPPGIEIEVGAIFA